MSEPGLAVKRLMRALVDVPRTIATSNWPWLRGDGWLAYSEHDQPAQVLRIDDLAHALNAALIEGSDPASRSWPGEATVDRIATALQETGGVAVFPGDEQATLAALRAIGVDKFTVLVGLVPPGSDPASPEANQEVGRTVDNRTERRHGGTSSPSGLPLDTAEAHENLTCDCRTLEEHRARWLAAPYPDPASPEATERG